MPDPPLVYVDFDDVLGETTRRLLDLHHPRSGGRVEFEDMREFDLGLSLGLTRDELDAFMHAAHEDAVLASVDPMKGARATLRDWVEQGASLAVMTGRPPHTAPVTDAWLERHGFPPRSIHFVDKYARKVPQSGGPQRMTLDQLAQHQFALAVEDNIETAAFLAEIVHVPVVLFDRPWNRDVSGLSAATLRRIVRCRDWAEVRARVPTLHGGLW
jgi:uncharacterized HAD superfamily protein